MTNAANWSGGIAPADNSSWAFTNSSVVALTNGFSSYTVSGILFTTNAGTYAITGSNFTLTGGITNISTAEQRISNGLTINSSVTLTNVANAGTSYITLGGALTGNGTITYGAANSGGRLVLQAGNNTNFSGALIANSGRVNIGSSNSVSPNADYTFNNSGGTFLAASNTTFNFGSLSGSGTISVNTAGSTNTISLGAKNSSTTFSGNISTNQNGTINVVKVGSGTLTLSGANAYRGETTIGNGVLQIGAGGTTGSISNTAAITLAGGSLAFNRSDNITQGVNFLTNGGIIAGTSTAGGLIKMGANTLTLTAANTYSGTTRIDAGKLVLSNGLAMQNSAFDTASGGVLSLATGVTTPTLGGLIGSGPFAPENYGAVTSLTLNTPSGASVSYSGTISNGATGMTLVKTGTGTQILSGNNSYSGGTSLNAGTLGVANASALGNGNLTVNGTTTLLAATEALTLPNDAVLASGSLTVDVQAFNFSSTGAISGPGSLSKTGAGTLTLGGTNTYSGGTSVGAGALAGNTTSLQGNITNNASIVFDQSATGTFGGVLSSTGNLTKVGIGTLILAGANSQSGGTLVSDGTLQIGDGGTTGSLAGAITNNALLAYNRSDNLTQSTIISGSGALTKSGNGTLTLGGNNTFSGKTTINAGAVSINADTRLGTAPGSLVSDQLTLDGGTLATTAQFTFNTNRGVTLGAAGGSISVGAGTVLTITNSQQMVTGAGSLTKIGSGTLALGGSNNFSGGTILSAGTLRLQASSVISAGNIIAGAAGVGNVTIDGGVLQGNAQSLYATNFTLNSDFAVNAGARGVTGNGRTTLGGLFDIGGTTRTIAVGGWTNASSVLQGGIESLRFGNNTDFNANYTNGSLRFVRDAAGTASDFVSVNFTTAGQKFFGGGGFVVGSNVITTFASGSVFTNAAGVLPSITVEEGGYLNFGSSNAANSQSIRSLSGSAGYVTSLANAASPSTATLTISNQAGDNSTFSGRIVDGSSLNATLGTSATNVAVALVKSGSGTQILAGNNTYSGATTVSAGALIINGDQSGAIGALSVASGAVVGGSGVIGGSAVVSGSVRPGNSIGTMTLTGDMTWNAGNAWVFELGSAAPSIASAASGGSTGDMLVIAGSGSDFVKGTGSSWTFDFAGTGTIGFYRLATWTGTTTFGAGNFAATNLFDDYTGAFSIQDSALYLEVVPEPSTYALLGFAALVLAARLIKRRKAGT